MYSTRARAQLLLTLILLGVIIYLLTAGCSSDNSSEDLTSLLKTYKAKSPVGAEEVRDALLYAGDSYRVWFRQEQPVAHRAFRAPGYRSAAFHVFRPGKFLGAVGVDAYEGVHVPQVKVVDGSPMILSYQFGAAAKSVEKAVYVVQVHLAGRDRLDAVLSEPFRPISYDPQNRLVMTAFALVEDSYGRILLMRVKYTSHRPEDQDRITTVVGESSYVWEQQARRFRALTRKDSAP